MTVRVTNSQRKVPINVKEIEEIAKKTLAFLGMRKAHRELGVCIVTDNKIKNLNRRFRGVDAPTDVLAFGIEEGEPIAGQKNFLGDVVISAEAARRVASDNRLKTKYELYRYLIHGILHLAGFKDGTIAERERMGQKENNILTRIWKGGL